MAFLPPVSGDPLSDEEIEQILARLPVLTAEPEDQVDFLLPEDSPPSDVAPPLALRRPPDRRVRNPTRPR